MYRRIFGLLLAALLLGTCALAENVDTSGIADASEMTDVIDIVTDDMVPVTGEQLRDGTYPVAVDVSSSMFKVNSCELTVADGELTAVLHMKSESYSYMYPGPAEEAAQAQPEALAALETTEDGEFTFTLPIVALDAGYTCAAFSARKQVWYPRTLVFRADSLPLEAWREEYLHTVETLGLADGEYTCAVLLEGAGRATLETPAALTVVDGVCTAEIVFSTSKIDYVIVDGEKHEPLNTEGGAAFRVPVAAFGRRLSIIVDSTAIQPAVEVQYTMTFDETTIEQK